MIPMEDTLLIDSSVMIAAFLETDTHHADSKRFFEMLHKGERDHTLIEPATVVLEIENVLIRLDHAREAASLHEYFSSVEIVPIDEEFIGRASPLLQKVRLKTADAIVAITAHLWEAVLISWDKKLIREGRRIVSAYTPKEYMNRPNELQKKDAVG